MLLQLNHITKVYPGVVALDDVSFEVREGEIHALVGENGAGKSTLIKTCTGAVLPDEGRIVINGQSFTTMTPLLSRQQGIAVIYQEFTLVPELSVAENIFLGRPMRKGIVIDRKGMVEKAREIFRQFGIAIDPDRMVSSLTVGYQQIVEIAKAVSQDAKLLIMDEPSAPLTKPEAECMFRIVDTLKSLGVAIIYISHRMDEIFRLSDRVTVMRDGVVVTTLETRDTSLDELLKLMVGRELKAIYPLRGDCIQPEVLLETRGLCGNGVADISFQLRRGEVLGLAGLIGSGRTQLAELLFGVKPRSAGKILFKGQAITCRTPRHAIDRGLALVPEDRKKQGVLLSMDVKANICMAILKRLSRASVVDTRKELATAKSYCSSINIKAGRLEQQVKNLSGGNQQKVVIAKWLASNAELIILDEPTRGIDVGAKSEIYTLINALVESGKAVLMISSEMEELMGMSDRIIVLSEGRMQGTLAKAQFRQETIMELASIGNDREEVAK